MMEKCCLVKLLKKDLLNKDNIDGGTKYKGDKSNESTLIGTMKELNVLIPMAGAGSRFEQAGYTFPNHLLR